MLAATRAGVCAILNTYHHTEGDSYIERFHRGLKEEEVWSSDYRYLMEARENISGIWTSTIRTARIAESETALPRRRSRLLQFLPKNEALTV